MGGQGIEEEGRGPGGRVKPRRTGEVIILLSDPEIAKGTECSVEDSTL